MQSQHQRTQSQPLRALLTRAIARSCAHAFVWSHMMQVKRACALDHAKQRLVIHLSVLTEPSLKPNKAVEATDKRRLLGEPEYPPPVFEVVASEISDATPD